MSNDIHYKRTPDGKWRGYEKYMSYPLSPPESTLMEIAYQLAKSEDVGVAPLPADTKKGQLILECCGKPEIECVCDKGEKW